MVQARAKVRRIPVEWFVLATGLTVLAAVAGRRIPGSGAGGAFAVETAFWAGSMTVLFAALLWEIAGGRPILRMVQSLLPRRDRGGP